MRNMRHHYAVLGAALLLWACASGAKRASTGLDSTPVSLTVTNQNWLDVDIFVLRGSTRYRLGAVGGNSSATLSIPTSLTARGEIQLLADPVGSNDVYVSGAISISPDQTVELTLAPRIRMSSYAIWTR
jgi:hypothetical protein